MVRPPFHVSVCPSPALGYGWGGLVTGLWPHLQLLCVGLFWSLGCAVLTPSPLAAPSPSISSPGFFFLGRLFGLGLVGCDPAWVPTFFWGPFPSLVLVFAGQFLPFGCLGSWYFLGIFT